MHSADWTVGSNAITPSKTYTIPSEVLSHNLVLLLIGKAGWYNSVILNKKSLTDGDYGGGIVLDFSAANSSSRDYITITISATGVISLKFYPSWQDTYHVYSYGLF